MTPSDQNDVLVIAEFVSVRADHGHRSATSIHCGGVGGRIDALREAAHDKGAVFHKDSGQLRRAFEAIG